MQSDELAQCTGLCTAPLGPGTPFEWPVLFVVDSIRVLIMLGATVLATVSVWAIQRSETRGQMLRFLSVVPLCLFVIGTELDRLGDWPHWRFVVGLTAISLLSWGYWEHFYREVPARPKTEEQGDP